MPSWLPPLVPLLPLLAAMVTAGWGRRLPVARRHVPCVAAAVGSFALAVVLLLIVLLGTPEGAGAATTVYDWIRIGSADFPLLHVPVVLRVDALSAIMLVTVTFVGMLVAIYSVGYMHGDPGYVRYFAEISLFIFSMTMLVLASNFLLLYVFWEAVGLCSYLLIGFWYQRPAAAAAAKKAFLVNRIGDFGFAIGIMLIWVTFRRLVPAGRSSLDFDAVFAAVGRVNDPAVLTTICLLLFAGAIGKSAQFPLHVWLPDAMEGPSPVSALIHAATMVTAGVYMVARCTPLFVASETARLVVACVGGFTALLAALVALTQNDLKRVLAYSTVSQLGYMFLGLGAGSLAGVAAGMFHLFTHAFFKALLFLGAGSVMHAMGGVIDMTRFSGLRRRLPATCWTFAVGAAALAGVPLLSGFWSKDDILVAVRHAAGGEGSGVGGQGSGVYAVLFWVGTVTAFLTAFYAARAFLKTFWGEEVMPAEAGEHAHESPAVMTWPLIVLAVGSLVVGLVVGPTGWFEGFLSRTPYMAPMRETAREGGGHWGVVILSSVAALGGIGLAWGMCGGAGSRQRAAAREWAVGSGQWAVVARRLRRLYELSYHKFYLDELYERFLVMPARAVAWVCRWVDWIVVDGLVNLLARLPRLAGRFGAVMHNGLVQWYALVMLVGLMLFLVIVLGGEW